MDDTFAFAAFASALVGILDIDCNVENMGFVGSNDYIPGRKDSSDSMDYIRRKESRFAFEDIVLASGTVGSVVFLALALASGKQNDGVACVASAVRVAFVPFVIEGNTVLVIGEQVDDTC